MYVYFYSLHVSGSHVPIIRRIIVSMRHLVYVTLRRWLSGMEVNVHTSDINQVAHWYNNSPDDGHMAARNMYRMEIYKDHTRMRGQQNVTNIKLILCFDCR